MACLTLVMRELADLNPDDFINVRAYHSYGNNFRTILRDIDPPSPTNIDSSGIGSLSSSASNEDSSTSTISTSSEILSTMSDEQNKETVKKDGTAEEDSKTKNEEPKVEVENYWTKNKAKNESKNTPKNDEIVNEGRDLLNLANDEPENNEIVNEGRDVLNLANDEPRRNEIIYEGRDLLDLASNISPFKCLFTPAEFGPENPEDNYVVLNRHIKKTPSMFTRFCWQCDFQLPAHRFS